MAISARNSMQSPGFDVGCSTLTCPSASTLTFTMVLNVVEICSGFRPWDWNATLRLPRRLDNGTS